MKFIHHVTKSPTHQFSVLLFVLTVLAYANSFSTGFPLDNKALILEDARVHAATGSNVDLILDHTYWWPIGESGLYRPVTTLSYLFNYAVLGNEDRPAGYHAFNLLLHIVNVLLVFALVRRIVGADPRVGPGRTHRSAPTTSKLAFSADSAFSAVAFWVAALWAVHPLSTEAVTNIVGRADLLAACGVLAGLLSYLRATESSGPRRLLWIAALAGATTLGVFSKESAVVIVGVIVLYEVTWRTRLRRSAPAWAAAAIALPLLLMWHQRSAVLGAAPAAEFPFVDNPIAGAGFLQGGLTAIAVMGRYLSLLVWPARLSADYSYAQIPLARGTAGDWIAWVAVAAVAIGVAAVFRRHRASFFFGAFALLTFLPTSNLLFPTGTIMAERVMYLPSVGLIALFVIAVCQAAVCQAALDVERERFASFAFLVIVVALGTRTWMRNRDWNDDVTLWTAAAKASPSSFKAHRALAEALYASDPTHANIDVLDRAIGEMERSVTLLQPLPDALNDIRTHRQLAAYHLERGDLRGRPALANRTALPPESIGAYQKAASLLRRCLVIIEAASGGRLHGAASADANRLLSAVYVRLHEADKAVDAALRARALEPSQVVGHQQLAAALLTAERYEEAAVALMAGSLLTSRPELRQQLIDLYRQGLDPLRCAVASIPTGSTGPTSLVLDPSCATVRRHLCAATVDAIALQTGAGERDDAERLRTSANELGCATGR